MKLYYDAWTPRGEARAVVSLAVQICEGYRAQGYDLTLRQLYYQFVARGHLANNMQSYNKLKGYVSKARLAGLLDWDYIVDRTRNLRGTSHWRNPSRVIESAANSYRLDKWASQPTRVELWVEKEALAGVIERTADALDLNWFACRGYVSQSEQWAAAQRFGAYIKGGQRVVILHLGDHDPSGIDMTRDIRERLENFIIKDWFRDHLSRFDDDETTNDDVLLDMVDHLGPSGPPIEIRRIALNMDQVEEYDPPPNPAKLTDSRAEGYIETYGHESWELDALDPATLDTLIRGHVTALRDDALYDDVTERESIDRETLGFIAERYDEVAEMFGRE